LVVAVVTVAPTPTIVAPSPTTEDAEVVDRPYVVLLWNDPITLMDVVVRVLGKVFGYSADKAERLMMTAHLEGKVPVWTGPREQAVRHCVALGTNGLQATVAEA
jgi:ATP-dependent Clp protease adaptor protein ClpS